MIDIPGPFDLFWSTLIWLGVPSLMLTPVLLVLVVAEWIRFGKSVRHAGQTGSDFWSALNEVWSVKLLAFMTGQALIAASVYSAFRLAISMNITDQYGRTIADGRAFTWEELWWNITTYSQDQPLPIQAFWVTIGCQFAFNLAHLLRIDALIRLFDVVVTGLIFLCVGSAACIGVVGLMVLGLASSESPGYTNEMVSLYALWVIFLAVASMGFFVAKESAEQVYCNRR